MLIIVVTGLISDKYDVVGYKAMHVKHSVRKLFLTQRLQLVDMPKQISEISFKHTYM
jgi:hypothetical protein